MTFDGSTRLVALGLAILLSRPETVLAAAAPDTSGAGAREEFERLIDTTKANAGRVQAEVRAKQGPDTIAAVNAEMARLKNALESGPGAFLKDRLIDLEFALMVETRLPQIDGDLLPKAILTAKLATMELIRQINALEPTLANVNVSREAEEKLNRLHPGYEPVENSIGFFDKPECILALALGVLTALSGGIGVTNQIKSQRYDYRVHVIIPVKESRLKQRIAVLNRLFQGADDVSKLEPERHQLEKSIAKLIRTRASHVVWKNRLASARWTRNVSTAVGILLFVGSAYFTDQCLDDPVGIDRLVPQVFPHSGR